MNARKLKTRSRRSRLLKTAMITKRSKKPRTNSRWLHKKSARSCIKSSRDSRERGAVFAEKNEGPPAEEDKKKGEKGGGEKKKKRGGGGTPGPGRKRCSRRL